MNDKKFKPFPVRKTRRLTLRRLTRQDKAAILSFRNNEAVCKFIARKKLTGENGAADFIERINSDINKGRLIYWVICLRGNPELIGTICLWNFSDDQTIAELGYELLPAHQGLGLMTEAIQIVLDYAFENCSLAKLEAYTHRENENSVKLIRKRGFQLVPGKVDKDNLNNEVYELHPAERK